jgi:hypothetical protein
MVHNQRFFDIYEILKRPQYSQHRSVICTDVRDVIFQYNPSEWITNNNVPKLTFGSELVHYKTEDWGIQNVLDGYKETGLDRVFENEIYNVGVINGRLQPFIDFCWILYWFSRGAHHNISDQSGLNMLLSTSFFEDVHLSADKTAWAAQLGTTLDPKTSRYWPLLTDTAPQVIDDMVVNSKHEPYCIAHQYDRIPFLKPIIDKKYE